MVLATDGIDSGFAAGDRAGGVGAGASPTGSSPSTARHADDALVVVVRYLPGG